MEKALAVANYFVRRAVAEDVELTPMKLVKLVYIAHGWCLALADKELIQEDVQAWKYGPVVPSVYYKFRQYGSGRIEKPGEESFSVSGEGIRFTPYAPELVNKNFAPLLDRVWEVYKKFSGIELSALTHQEGTPWDIAYNKLGGKDKSGFPIPNEIIKEHYKKRVNSNA